MPWDPVTLDLYSQITSDLQTQHNYARSGNSHIPQDTF